MSPGLVTAIALTALPSGSARYRFELLGEPVGFAEQSVRCSRGSCLASFTAVRRAPAEAGGAVSSWRAEVEVDRDGRFRGGAIRVAANGPEVAKRGIAGLVPASVVEVVLAAEAPLDGSERCVKVFEEETTEAPPFTACARREGGAVVAMLEGSTPVRVVITPAPDGFPAALEMPEQGARFVREPRARVPDQPPRLHGARVSGPSDPGAARSFCGVARDPPSAAADLSRLPPPNADGASCREKTAAWLMRARRAGFPGRTAVGVAWDGTQFVWHAWAEVRAGGEWIAIDPSFGEAPARSPRFTVARHGEDPASRLQAGQRILACWGKAAVEAR